MLKVKDGYAKLIDSNLNGSIDQILLSNGGTTSTSTFAKAAHSHVWTDITNHPTKLSEFTDDVGYLTAHLTLDRVIATDVLETQQITPPELIGGLQVFSENNELVGLKDGGNYHGVILLRGFVDSMADFTFGTSTELAFTDNANLWIRNNKSAMAWNAWQRFAKADEIPTKLKDLEDGDISNLYLPLTGGTLTGPLILTSDTFNYIGNYIGIKASSQKLILKDLVSNNLEINIQNSKGEELARGLFGKNSLNSPVNATITSLTVNSGLLGSALVLNTTGVQPRITFKKDNVLCGYLTYGAETARELQLYGTNNYGIKNDYTILSKANSYVDEDGYGTIDLTKITKVKIADALLNYTTVNIDKKIDDNKVIAAQATNNGNHFLCFGTKYLAECQFNLDTKALQVYIRYGLYDDSGNSTEEWSTWIRLLNTSDKTVMSYEYNNTFKTLTNDAKLISLTIGDVTKKLTVDYATNSILLLNGNSGNNTISDLNLYTNCTTDSVFLVYDFFNLKASNLPKTTAGNSGLADNANALLTLVKSKHSLTNNYCNLLAFGTNDAIWYRYCTGEASNNWSDWHSILMDNTLTVSTAVNKLTITTPKSTNSYDISVDTTRSLGVKAPLTGRNLEYDGVYTFNVFEGQEDLIGLYYSVLGFGYKGDKTDGSGYGCVELAGRWIGDDGDRLKWRVLRDTITDWSDWRIILDDMNYKDYLSNMYWANINTSKTPNTATTPLFGSIGIGTSASIGNSITALSTILSLLGFLAGNTVTNSSLFVGDDSTNVLQLIAKLSSQTNFTTSSSFTFVFQEGSIASNEVTTSWKKSSGSSVKIEFTNITTYKLDYYVNSDGYYVLYLGRLFDTTLARLIDTVSVTYTEYANLLYYTSVDTPTQGFMHINKNTISWGNSDSLMHILNSYLYSTPTIYKKAGDDLYKQPVFLFGIYYRCSNNTWQNIGEAFSIGYNIVASVTAVTASSKYGYYRVVTNLSTDSYSGKFMPMANGVDNYSTAYNIDARVVQTTYGNKVAFNVSTSDDDTYNAANFHLYVWYMP